MVKGLKPEQTKSEGVPWLDFLEISELLHLDLDETAIGDLEQARKDRVAGNKEACRGLDEIECYIPHHCPEAGRPVFAGPSADDDNSEC